jgi:CAAX prenyl protease-like protein
MWPYLAPMVAFMGLTSLEGYLPRGPGGAAHPAWYPAFYALKMAVVTATLVAGRRVWAGDLRARPSAVALAMAVGLGLLVTAGWVGLERLDYPRMGLGDRQAFDPGTIAGPGRLAFLAVRLFGLVLLVPLFEELFWRSFLIRWIIDQDFARVPLGTVTPVAAGVTSALFAAAHPEWLPALLTGLAWAWLLWKTKSLRACVVSHAAANLALGVYVLTTGAYGLW